MSKIQDVLKSKWSVVFALVPFVNVVYFAYFALFSKEKALFFLWAIPATLFPSALVLHYLPEHLRFWGYFLFFAAIGLVLFFRREKNVQGLRASPRLLLLLIPLIALAILIPASRYKQQVSRIATEAATAISGQNQDEWDRLLHPKCDKELRDLQAFCQDSFGTAAPEMDPDSVAVKSMSIKSVNQTSMKHFVVKVEINNTPYILDIAYLRDEDGEGIQAISVNNGTGDG